MIEYQQYISDIVVGIATIAGIGMYVKNKIDQNGLTTTKYETEMNLFNMLKENLEISNNTIKELNLTIREMQNEVKTMNQQIEELEYDNNQLLETKKHLENKIILMTNLINRLTNVIDEATVKIENVISEE